MNGQDDIIGILDSTGTQVVSYEYDTWGKLLSVSGSLASTIGEINPFLYRGYYYDSESGLFYVGSRYYDPTTCRFLNADDSSVLQLTQGDVLGANLFAYCNNNPVMGYDPMGYYSVTGGGSKYVSVPDPSYSCTIKLMVQYEYLRYLGKDYIRLTLVTGSVSKPSPLRVRIISANLTMGQTGFYYRSYKSQSGDYNLMKYGIYSNGGSFSIKPPGTWGPVANISQRNAGSTVGANITIKFQIGTGQPWSKTIVCNIL